MIRNPSSNSTYHRRVFIPEYSQAIGHELVTWIGVFLLARIHFKVKQEWLPWLHGLFNIQFDETRVHRAYFKRVRSSPILYNAFF